MLIFPTFCNTSFWWFFFTIHTFTLLHAAQQGSHGQFKYFLICNFYCFFQWFFSVDSIFVITLGRQHIVLSPDQMQHSDWSVKKSHNTLKTNIPSHLQWCIHSFEKQQRDLSEMQSRSMVMIDCKHPPMWVLTSSFKKHTTQMFPFGQQLLGLLLFLCGPLWALEVQFLQKPIFPGSTGQHLWFPLGEPLVAPCWPEWPYQLPPWWGLLQGRHLGSSNKSTPRRNWGVTLHTW